MRGNRRGRRIAMNKAELDLFLDGERTCRVATASPHGPHLTALWYVWDGTALWLTSVVASQRWTDLRRDPRVAVLVDAGGIDCAIGYAGAASIAQSRCCQPPADCVQPGDSDAGGCRGYRHDIGSPRIGISASFAGP